MTLTRQQSPSLSVIVPVYNGERYLPRLFRTLEEQRLDSPEATGVDCEVIIVNDGSTDRSVAMLEEFASSRPWVRVITTPNGGLSHARNTGIDAACKEYVYLLDCDDIMARDVLVPLTKALAASDMPLLRFRFEFVREGEEEKFVEEFSGRPLEIHTSTAKAYLRATRGLYMDTSAWSSIISRDFLNAHSIRFNNRVRRLEDMPFSWRLFSEIDTLMVCDTPVYGYVERPDGLLNSHRPEHLRKYLPSFIPFLEEMREVRPGNDTEEAKIVRKAIDRKVQIHLLGLWSDIITRGFLSDDEIDFFINVLEAKGFLPLRTPYPYTLHQSLPHPALLYALWLAQRRPSILRRLVKSLAHAKKSLTMK